MICVRLEGGLGNQLFQYAAGRALAQRHATGLLLDLGAFDRHGAGVTPRKFQLHHFRHAGRLAMPHEVRNASWLRRAPALAPWLTHWKRYHVEQELTFDAAFAALPDNTYLHGYWQSHRYFEGIGAQLLEDLQPANPMSERSHEVAIEIDSSLSVALHVRRGDYVTLAAAARLHGALSADYYADSVSSMRTLLGAPRFFVFSDDLQWCQAHLPLRAAEATFVSHNETDTAWQDLELMSRCRHHVIANSSFSWWGAWLADQRWAGSVRQVIAPGRWFRGQQHDTRDRFPSHWKTYSNLDVSHESG
jgi:hypothetical protein